jgi:enoyl-CoA hydratase
MGDATVPDGTRYVLAGHRLLNRLEDSRIVFVSVVDGVALGGGTELALACDLVIASDRAVFGLPETSLGLIPGWGGTQRLVRAVGQIRAKEMIYTGRRVDAAEAVRTGIVNQVVTAEELEECALSLTDSILANSPSAVADAKVVTTQGQRLAMEPGMALEVQTWLKNLSSPNRREGLTAFVERRKPQFEVEE